jgi:hypothetical protein
MNVFPQPKLSGASGSFSSKIQIPGGRSVQAAAGEGVFEGRWGTNDGFVW